MNFKEESLFFPLVHNGKYFFPAWKHYGNPQTTVVCDRCLKSNLIASIGWENRDLCMNCTEIICNKYYGPPFIEPRPINPYLIITDMLNK